MSRPVHKSIGRFFFAHVEKSSASGNTKLIIPELGD